MKVSGFLILATLGSIVQAARPAGNRAAAGAPPLKPQQSNPTDPGNAFTPRTQSGCLSNIGIGLPTGGSYYHQGDPMAIMIRADMFLPSSDTNADVVDANGNSVAPIIATFPALNFTTITTTVPMPTQMTPGTYSLRFQQTYSNTFASGMRSQTLEFEVIVASSGAALPTPAPTVSVNAIGVTVTFPPPTTSGAPVNTASVPGGNPSGSGGSSAPTAGGNSTNTTGDSTTPTKASGSGAAFYVDSLGIVLAVVLGFVGVLAAL